MGVKKIYIQNIEGRSFSIYKTFKQKKGSEHISSPVGIQVLLDVIEEIKPKNILEVGGGIGALSYTALRHSDAHIDIFENHPFCIEELKKNLKGFEDRYTILMDYTKTTPPRDNYDLIIIDGGGHAFIHSLLTECRHIGRIIVEGGRREQRKQTRKALKSHYLFRPIHYKYTDNKYKGAHQIICYESNNPLFRFFAYWFWEIVIYEEIYASLRHRFKKMFSSKA